MTFALETGVCGCASSTENGESSKEGKEYSFVQVTETFNTYSFVDAETDAFEVNTTKEEDGIASRIYKPASGNTLVVEFHGNGEGGTEEGTLTYILHAEVLDDGEKVTKIEILTNGLDIDETALNPDDFKITRTNYESSEPIEVASIEKDEEGDLILSLEITYVKAGKKIRPVIRRQVRPEPEHCFWLTAVFIILYRSLKDWRASFCSFRIRRLKNTVL